MVTLNAPDALASSSIDVIVSNDISLDISPIVGGVFGTSDISATTISVKTNHYTGYTLGVLSKNGNNSLVNTLDNTKTIPSLTNAVSESEYNSSSNLNNTWGYRPSKYHSIDNDDYLPIPTSTTAIDLLDQTSAPNQLNANNYNVALGARLDDTVTTGSYSSTLVFVVTANPIPYSITHNKNTTDEVANMPTNVVNPDGTYDETVALSTNIPTRSDYRFIGWCTMQIVDNADCPGTQYSAGDMYSLNQTSTNDINLYAIWKEGPPPLSPSDCSARSICYAPNAKDIEGSMSVIGVLPASPAGGRHYISPNSIAVLMVANYKRSGYGLAGWSTAYEADPESDTIYGLNETISTDPNNGGVDVSTNGLILYPVWVASAGNMQNWTGCSSMSIGEITALTDTRDNNVYSVAKLADGKCWMTENLRLDHTPTLTANNTFNPKLPLIDSNGTSTSNHLSAPISPYTTAWCTAGNANCINKSMLATDNTTNLTASAAHSLYSYGNIYNWYSATAGRGYDITSGEAGGDICPKGWRMPKGTTNTINGDFSILDIALGGTGTNQNNAEGTTQSVKWRSYPNNFVYSGYIYGASIGGRNYNTRYWTSTPTSSSSALILTIDRVSIRPGNSSATKSSGAEIRCLSNP